MHLPDSSGFGDATDPPLKSESEHRQFLNRLKKVWKAMESLVNSGLVQAIDVSNFGVHQIKELIKFTKIILAVNQVDLHPFWRQDELVKFCQMKCIHVSAHTLLGVPTSSLRVSDSRSVHGPMLKFSIVGEIADRHKKTPEHVILWWGFQRGISVIPYGLLNNLSDRGFMFGSGPLQAIQEIEDDAVFNA
ncbi:hypothetical protein ES288_A11G285300v1 [Gossypium darwinii]|uniref:NADP-dependent oxidoreductase domain-containing protein n=1 Tax=Gossypium darwinii TaxID=34276 RepID=A0A5D2ES48_GOSDA|nr:hypothetical protein ES288_A11G285300v1 [Gossypium darwinii]